MSLFINKMPVRLDSSIGRAFFSGRGRLARNRIIFAQAVCGQFTFRCGRNALVAQLFSLCLLCRYRQAKRCFCAPVEVSALCPASKNLPISAGQMEMAIFQNCPPQGVSAISPDCCADIYTSTEQGNTTLVARLRHTGRQIISNRSQKNIAVLSGRSNAISTLCANAQCL